VKAPGQVAAQAKFLTH